MELKRLKKQSEEVIHENPWTRYKHDVYEKPNGQSGDYYYLETPGAVIIVPFLPDGRVVMTLQYRYLNDKQSIAFPCGGIKDGMEALEAAKLELREETGCIAENWIFVGAFEPSTGCIKDKTHVFVCEVVEQGPQYLDDTEQIDLLSRKPEEIDDMIARNDIWSGQTIAAWAMSRGHFPSPDETDI